MSAIFNHNDEQKRLAMETRSRQAIGRKSEIRTQTLSVGEFCPVEDYHQKYALRQDPDLMREFIAIYPSSQDFVNSTAVARVNGYVSGYGTLEGLQRELNQLGLSPQASKRLLEIVQKRSRGSRLFSRKEAACPEIMSRCLNHAVSWTERA